MHGCEFQGWRRTWCAGAVSWLLVLLTPAHAMAANDFRARGNEPNWSLTITDAAIELQTMDGKTATISPVPQRQASGWAETYAGQADGQSVTIIIADAVCNDTMSGMPHPKSVAVTWGDLVLTGCGGDPATLIQGEWAIESINGRAVLAEAKPTLSLDPDGNLSGGGICNRFFGGYVLTGEGLTFGQMGSTQMACEQAFMDEEALLLQSFGKIGGFAIDNCGVLTLKGPETEIVARRM